MIAISYWEWGGLVDPWLREWVTLSRPVKLHWHLTYQGYKTLRLWEYNSSLLWPAWCRGRGLFRVWREPLCKYYLLCTNTMAEMEDAAVLGRRSRAWSDQPCVCRWSKGIQTIQSTSTWGVVIVLVLRVVWRTYVMLYVGWQPRGYIDKSEYNHRK